MRLNGGEEHPQSRKQSSGDAQAHSRAFGHEALRRCVPAHGSVARYDRCFRMEQVATVASRRALGMKGDKESVAHTGLETHFD